MVSSNSSMNVLLPVLDPPRNDESLFKGSAVTKRGAYAAISYMACAVLLVLFNKAVLSTYSFPCVNVITLFQLVTMESVRGISVPMYTTLRRTTVVFTMIVEHLLSFPGIVCEPTLLFWTFIWGDLEMTINFPHLYSPGFQAFRLLNGVTLFCGQAAAVMAFSGVTDSDTSVLVSVNHMVCRFQLNVMGQVLGFLGSGLYAYCKLSVK